MALFHLGSRRSQVVAQVEDAGAINLDGSNIVQVNISIHDTPHYDDRIGEALCLVAPGHHPIESSGAVVPINRHPHRVTRNEFARLIDQAGRTGHLLDGYLEIEAIVDVDSGTITWQPEDGSGVDFENLDQIVENTFASLVETNLFGFWFVPTSFQRRVAVVN